MTLADLATYVALPMISLAIVLVLFRLLRGPSLPDRIVALDFLASLGIGFIAVYAIANREPVFLDVATILALVSFLGTIAFAYYIQKRN